MRVAVVTGASSGIGEAIARRLAEREWRCVLLARREERLREIAREVDGEYEVCDVGERGQVERIAAAVLERHPRVGLLVNSAGIPGRRGFLAADPETIEAAIRVNYLGSVWSLRAFLPALEAGAPAHVVNIVSVAGEVAFPPSGPYSAAKHAQLAFSRATAAELRERGIRVHTVMPGFVQTEGFPQSDLVRIPVLGRLVAGPDTVARHVVRVVERNERESHVPRWYRIAPITQVIAPWLVRLVTDRAPRDRDIA